VQAEVTRCLATPEDFLDVPANAPNHFRKASGLFRDTPGDARPAFIVRDGNYLSARWPGDVHTLALTFAHMLAEKPSQSATAGSGRCELTSVTTARGKTTAA
jgi:hypothetical protein